MDHRTPKAPLATRNAGAARPGGRPSIRRAGPADAAALAAVGRATFVEAFGHLYPPDDLAAFLESAHSRERARADLADAAKAVWLAQIRSRVVGYALAGPCKLPHPDASGACGELERLYVLAEARSAGLGSRLLDQALGWLEADGPRRIWIGVWSENLGAQRLYARHGFEVVGSYAFAVGAVRDHELILRREPGRAGSPERSGLDMERDGSHPR